MRILVILVVVMGSLSAIAHKGTDGDGGLKLGKCYPAFPSHYIVAKTLGKNQYELRGNWMSPHAVLNTTKITKAEISRLREMGPINMDLRYMGTKTMAMDNGFEASVDQWAECISSTELKDSPTPGPSPKKSKSTVKGAFLNDGKQSSPDWVMSPKGCVKAKGNLEKNDVLARWPGCKIVTEGLMPGLSGVDCRETELHTQFVFADTEAHCKKAFKAGKAATEKTDK